MGSTCCGRGKEGTASAPPRKHGEEPTARRELADPLPALSRGPLRRGTQPRWLKCAVNQSPCSARHGDSHCLGELRQDGKVKEVSAGVLSPREPPRLVPPVGHHLSKKGTTMSPGEASALGPRAAPCQSQSFPKDNRNQRLLQFAWDELRRLRVGLGWAGGHGLQEGSNRTQGCSALGSQRAGQARPCPQLLLPNTLV